MFDAFPSYANALTIIEFKRNLWISKLDDEFLKHALYFSVSNKVANKRCQQSWGKMLNVLSCALKFKKNPLVLSRRLSDTHTRLQLADGWMD